MDLPKIVIEFQPVGWTASLSNADYSEPFSYSLGVGTSRTEAVDDLIEEIASNPTRKDATEIYEAFTLDMAEKGIHKDDWCNRFGEWLDTHLERDFKADNQICEGRR